jgi:hypothetical protein
MSPAENEIEVLVEEYGEKSLPGTLSAIKRDRLRELLTEDPEAGAIEVFEAWHPSNPITSEEASTRSEGALRKGPEASEASDSYDPETDPAPTTSRARVKRAYDAALEAGFDDEAEYLRKLSLQDQLSFAKLLQRGFLKDSAEK